MGFHFAGGHEKLPNFITLFKVPVFALRLSPPPDSLRANFLGHTSDSTITSRQLSDLIQNHVFTGFGRQTGLVGLKKKKRKKEENEFNKKYLYIFLFSFKAPFFCLP